MIRVRAFSLSASFVATSQHPASGKSGRASDVFWFFVVFCGKQIKGESKKKRYQNLMFISPRRFQALQEAASFFCGLPGSGAGSATLGQTPVLCAEPDADQNSDFYLMRIRIRNFI
jgi:hypothetical protein